MPVRSFRTRCVVMRSLTFGPTSRQLHPRRQPLHFQKATARPHRASKGWFMCRAEQDLYRVLGVERGATAKEIKSAFKAQALKLHPDVNSAPDAAERFKNVRHAYQVLSNPESRSAHDRDLRRGSLEWDFPFGTSRPRSSRSGSYTPEPVYGLEDVFRDLGEAFSEFSKTTATPTDEIGSLWEELASLGQEFVEFLEEEAGIGPPLAQQPPTDTPKQPPQSEAEPESPPSLEDDVEQALQELKRRMGL